MSNPASQSRSTNGIGITLLGAIFSAALLLQMLPYTAAIKLNASAEAREAHVVAEMIDGGDYILPRRAGHIPSKPPLYHWIAAAAAAVDGDISPAAARLPSVLFGALTLWLTVWLASRISTDSRGAGLLAGVILSTSYGFLALTQRALVDMTFSFFVVAACAVSILRLSEALACGRAFTAALRTADLALIAALAGAATLAKGPLGALLPAIMIVLFALRFGSARSFGALLVRLPIPALIYLLVAAPWYWLAAGSGGEAFVWRQFIFENIDRFLGGEGVNYEPWWFYIPSILRTLFPWSIPLIAALFAKRRADPAANNITAGLLLWIGAALVFFSLSSGKRHSYLLPLYPIAALYLALRWQDLRQAYPLLQKGDGFAARLADPAAAAITAALIFTLLSGILPQSDFIKFVAENQLPLLAGQCAALFLYALLRGTKQLALRSWAPIFSLYCLILTLGGGYKQDQHDFDRMAALISTQLPADQRLSVWRPAHDGFLDQILFYLRRPVTPFGPETGRPLCPGFVILPATAEAASALNGVSYTELLRTRTRTAEKRGSTDKDVILAACF